MSDWKEFVEPVWNYEVDKEIVGVLVRRIPSQYGSVDFVLSVKDKGDVIVHGKKVLQTKLRTIIDGTLIKIEHVGKVKGKSNLTYEDFKVYVQ